MRIVMKAQHNMHRPDIVIFERIIFKHFIITNKIILMAIDKINRFVLRNIINDQFALMNGFPVFITKATGEKQCKGYG